MFFRHILIVDPSAGTCARALVAEEKGFYRKVNPLQICAEESDKKKKPKQNKKGGSLPQCADGHSILPTDTVLPMDLQAI